MKFAHLGDCHLGGWRQPELRELNVRSFQEAIRRCIKEKVEFVVIAGDFFDSAYPPIETLKQTFEEFRKLKEANIPVFLIAGSHDYSVSGKSFLDVLEKAGFSKNVAIYKEHAGKIILEPTIYKNVAIYGYPGRKSGMEVDEIANMKINDAPGMFRILMLHTAVKGAIGEVPVKSVDEKKLPKVDYIALGHLHIHYQKDNLAYSGPLFPNNLSEIEELQGGSFIIFENGRLRREEIKLKEVFSLNLEITNALTATENIIALIKNENIKNKIIVIRLSGILEKGKISDIDFHKIETELQEKGAYVVLKSTSKLHTLEQDAETSILISDDIEGNTIKKFLEKNNSSFNALIPSLLSTLQIEKGEDETTSTFEERLLLETRNILNLQKPNNEI